MYENLRGYPAFRGFTDSEFDTLVSATTPRTVTSGAVLIQAGATGTSCFLVVRGILEVQKPSPEGERTVATVNPGTWVGQIALVDRGRRSATVVARSEAEVLELSRDTFERLLKSKSSLALRFQQQIAVTSIRQLRAATTRLAATLAMKGTPTTPAPPGAGGAGGANGAGGAGGAGGASGPGDTGVGELSVLHAATTEWSIALDDEDLESIEVVRDADDMALVKARTAATRLK